MALIGIGPDQIRAADEVAAFRLGTRGSYDDPDDGCKEYIYVKATEAVTGLGYLCVIGSGFEAEMVDTTSSAPGTGQGFLVGAAQAAIAENGFGWLQVQGKGSLRTLASAAAGTALTSSATPGAVDDATTAGLEVINGLALGTATGVLQLSVGRSHPLSLRGLA
ncbi:MAG: hypothetical protein LC667_02195 [Thioalkalivibrio sp.]|nr:hypothetical protein [Thioalkalivibrio sp.]